jgi:hypothetical protein
MQHQQRKLRLIRPRLQLRWMLSFLDVRVLALLLQYLIFIRVLSELASQLPHDGELLMGEFPGRLLSVLFLSSVVLFPATLYGGVLATRRIAAPPCGFEIYLKQVLRGEARGECRFRKGDGLLDSCSLINQATLPLRRHLEGTTSEPGPTREDPRAAA